MPLADLTDTPAAVDDRFYLELGQRVKDARSKLGLSQELLADKVGLKRVSITNIEKGRQRMPIHTLVVMAQALSIDVQSLLPSMDSFTAAVAETLHEQLGNSPEHWKHFVRSVIAKEKKASGAKR